MAEPTQTSKTGFSSDFVFALLKFSSFIVFFAACGLVRYQEVLCVLLSSLYLYIISRYVFPPVTAHGPPSVYKGSKVLAIYITFAAIVGVYLPVAYIILGVVMADKETVQTAASHTFLLAAQVVSERLTSSFSYPARALVPILYNSGRLVSIWSWIQSEFFNAAAHGSFLSAPQWVLLRRSLAVANLILWTYNLFCFLVPMYLPICFRKYFEDEKAGVEQGRKAE